MEIALFKNTIMLLWYLIVRLNPLICTSSCVFWFSHICPFEKSFFFFKHSLISQLPSFPKLSYSNSLNTFSEVLVSRPLNHFNWHLCILLMSIPSVWNAEIKLHTYSYFNWDLFSNTCSHPAVRIFKSCFFLLFFFFLLSVFN